MNYVAVNPNAFYNLSFQNNLPFSRPSQMPLNPSQAYNLLQNISKALRSSLSNYEERYNQTSQNIVKVHNQARNEPACRENSPEVIRPVIDEELHKENLKNNMEEEKEQICLQNQVNVDKSVQGQIHTDDQIVIQSSSLRKDGSSKKKNKKINKERKEEKKDQFVVVVPEVDLIDDAYLPPQCFSPEQLALKKEELIMRRVLDCKDFVKGRKEKREIRMLGN